MLEFLRIQNLALIEDMELEFSPGLNVLTGETGAGKSFILKALTFLAGERLGADLVRPGAEKAQAEGLFIMPDGTEHILRRELTAESGRSRIFLNDALVSQEKIRELRPSLLLHSSQHGQQQLLSPVFQAGILDAFMAQPEVIEKKDRLIRELKAIAARRRELEERAAQLAQQREILEFQQQEIDKVNPLPGEEEELESLRQELRRVEAQSKTVEEALETLHGRTGGFDDPTSLVRGLEKMERLLHALAEDDESFQPDYEALTELAAGLRDLDGRLRRLAAASPEKEQERIEARLYTLAQLKRKLHRPMEHILALREEIAENLSFLDSCALDAKQLAREEEAACARLAAHLARLNPARREAAARLGRALEEELRGLGFSEHVAVGFAFSPHILHPGHDGCVEERARLLWRPNPGQPEQPLDKIASGGELSRFLLALVSLLSRKSGEEATLIFDEVDAGVGGLTLNRVAEKLGQLAADRQLLVITHWPQLAARSSRHFRVRKEVRGGDTFTLCERLSPDEQRKELARMAGGGPMGEALARELVR